MDVETTRVQEIVTLHQQIAGHLRQSLEKAIRIGQLLIEQKASLDHGQFSQWVEGNLPFTIRTAQNYMRLTQNKALVKNETVSHLTGAYNLLKQPHRYKDDLRFFKTAEQRLLVTLMETDIDKACCHGKFIEREKYGGDHCVNWCHGQCGNYGKGDNLLDGGICFHPRALAYGQAPESWQSKCPWPGAWTLTMKACPRETHHRRVDVS
jgi:hypothetical protein